jgi:outer membrane protein OmpA-like peptidoglycan-associated protein
MTVESVETEMTSPRNNSRLDKERACAQARAPALKQRRLVGEHASIWPSLMLACLGAAFSIAALASFDPPERATLLEQRWFRFADGVAAQAAPGASTEVVAAPTPQPQEWFAARMDILDGESTTRSEAPPISQAALETIECPRGLAIPFAFGSAHLDRRRSSARLKTFADWASKRAGALLLVEGRIDPTGNERRNVILSFRRAKAVAAELSALGVAERQILVRAGRGNESDVSSGPSSRGRSVALSAEGVSGCRKDGTTTERQ